MITDTLQNYKYGFFVCHYNLQLHKSKIKQHITNETLHGQLNALCRTK